MQNKKKKDHQTLNLFVILIILTLLTVLVLKVVLFGPQSFVELGTR